MKENQLSRYGAIARMLPFTVGKIFFVINNSDPAFAEFQHEFPPDKDGVIRVYSTIEAAYAATVSNRNDIIVVDSTSTHDLTAMLTVAKNRVHFIGLDWLMGDKRHYGQRSKIKLGVTAAATDIGTIKVTGVGCSFKGIKFMNENTKDESLYCLVDAGEYAYYESCEFYKSTDLDVAGASEVLLNSDSSKFKDCIIGSLANAISGAIIRPCILVTKGLGGTGKVCRDGYFENCQLWRNAGNAANRFVYGANANDVERMLMFKDCSFVCNGASAGTPAQAIAFAAPLSVGYVIAKNCTSVGCTKLSTTTGVLVDGPAPNAGAGIAVNAA